MYVWYKQPIDMSVTADNLIQGIRVDKATQKGSVNYVIALVAILRF